MTKGRSYDSVMNIKTFEKPQASSNNVVLMLQSCSSSKKAFIYIRHEVYGN